LYLSDLKALPEKEVKPLKNSRLDKFVNNIEINFDLATNAQLKALEAFEQADPDVGYWHIKNSSEFIRNAHALSNLERLKIRDPSSANAIKNHIEGADLISPQMKSIIDSQKKLTPKYYQNSYYKRRNSYNYGNSNSNNQLASQIASQIAKTFVASSNSFFPDGGKDTRRILSKPETATSLHPKEVIVVENEVVDLMETEGTKIRPEGTDRGGGKSSQRGPIKDIFAAVAHSRSGIFSKKRNDANLYGQNPGGKVLEGKHTVQGILGERTGNEDYGQENKRRDNQRSIDRDGQKVTKVVQSVQISPEIEWELPASSRYAGSKSVYETDIFQNGGYTDSGTTHNEKRFCGLV
jgi:hypothetical protein